LFGSKKRSAIEKESHDLGFLRLREGGFDAELNKWVRKIIFQTETLAVYVDWNYEVQFLIDDEIDAHEFGKVQTEVTYLELESSFLSRDKDPLLHVRSLLGEAYARVMQTQNASHAAPALGYARSILVQKNSDVSYRWYFGAAAWMCGLLAIAGGLFWFFRRLPVMVAHFGGVPYELVICAVAGAIGALLSIVTRANNLTLNARAGKRAHTLEARGRILTGMFSASFLVMAIKAKLILATLAVGDGHRVTLILLASLAGFSERVIPSLVRRFEDAVKSHDGAGPDKLDNDAGKPATVSETE
jgi:hypothetical protein